jgi:hypothetical protein
MRDLTWSTNAISAMPLYLMLQGHRSHLFGAMPVCLLGCEGCPAENPEPTGRDPAPASSKHKEGSA